MKALALSLILVAASAHAEVIATSPAKNGGTIYLTDVKDACPGDSHGYGVSGFANQGIVSYGCWIGSGNNVIRREEETGLQWVDNAASYTRVSRNGAM